MISMNGKKMRYSLKVMFGAILCASATVANGQFLPNQAQPEYIPGKYIVVLDEVEVQRGVFAAARPVTTGFEARVSNVYGAAFTGFAASLTDVEVARLKADPRVAHIEQDQVVRISAKPAGRGKPGGGGGTTQPPQSTPWGISRILATQSTSISGDGTGSVDVDVAIIDTGIDLAHPDLTVVGGRNFTSGKVTSYGDGNGHGTHVAGTVAALDNTIGVVGVAPGARLWAVRVLDSTGSGTMSGVIAGVDWVTANASTIEVANMSLGGGDSAALNSAIDNAVAAGVTFVVAAGNSAVDSRFTSPANSTNPGVITVSALDQSGVLAYFSNYGLNYSDDGGLENGVDVTAPGMNIYSTYKGSTYATLSGTSMASPHACGAAALCKAANPSFTPDQVKQSVVSSAPAAYLGTGASGIFGIAPWAATGGDPDGFTEPLINASGY